MGPKRAKHLLKHFSSVERTLTAKVEQLREVEGIGEGVAETLCWSVKERHEEYEGCGP